MGPRFLVKKISVGKSRLLKKEEIDGVVKKYEGKFINISELQLVIRDLNNLYVGKKGGLSRAVLPPQKIKSGVVQVILVESRLGAVIFEDTKYTSRDYLKWALPIKSGDEGLSFTSLEKKFLRFNIIHKGMRVSSELRPGKNFGETDVIVKISEMKRWGGSIFLDNEGSQSTGQIRYGAIFQSGAALGFDDQVIAGATKSSGQVSGFLSYDFPFTPVGTRGTVLYSKSKQDVVGGSYSDIGLEGGATFFSARVTQNIWADKSLVIETFGELSSSDSVSLLGGFELETSNLKYSSRFECKAI